MTRTLRGHTSLCATSELGGENAHANTIAAAAFAIRSRLPDECDLKPTAHSRRYSILRNSTTSPVWA